MVWLRYFSRILIWLITISCCADPLHLSANSVSNVSEIQTAADILLDKIYAVHATRTLPEPDCLRAGWALDRSTPIERVFLSKIRNTLHFALGEVVRPVEAFMNWEDCPYAVVTTVRNLLPQLLNINCYDSFILGDLKLDANTYLILPIDVAEKTISRATIVSYDPKSKTLRQAVDDFIQLNNGWHILMDSEDIEDELHAAYLDGQNVNTIDFFQPLKHGRPWLAVGLRFNALDGEHFRLAAIEQALLLVAMQMLSTSPQENLNHMKLDNFYLENTVAAVNEHFKKWSASMNGFEWGVETKQAFRHIETEIKKWECLIHEELRIREQYGKTLMSAPHDVLLECASVLNQPEALETVIDQNLDRLPDFAK